MRFQEALASASSRPPLMFEPVPPPKDLDEARLADHIHQLEQALASIPHLSCVNVPQIEGGAYETVDALDFGARIQQATGHDVAVNKIVAHDPPERLIEWVRHARSDKGIRHLIHVGGESSDIDYPGPSVSKANRLISGLDTDAPLTIGNICIPFRRRPDLDEPDRMLKKTQNGADYFTSQIVLEPVTTRRLVRDYERACRLANTKPAAIFIGLSPVTEKKDLKLLKILGVEIPPNVERELLWDPDAIQQRSLEMNLGILRNILTTLRAEHIQVPVGLNVEQVSLGNWEASIELAEEATLLLEEHAWLMEDEGLVPEAPRTASTWNL
jgi:5,10-methylenetetrahydrofolate reductase